MPISISSQAYVFLCAVICGAAIGFLYDLLRIKRRTFKTNALFVGIEDLIYWIVVAVVMFLAVYYSNDGEVRGYIFIGTVLGTILYMLLLSKIVIKSFLLIIRAIFTALKIVWKVVSFPFRLMFKIFRPPFLFIAKMIGKFLKNTKRAGRTRVQRAAAWRRILRNVRKKF